MTDQKKPTKSLQSEEKSNGTPILTESEPAAGSNQQKKTAPTKPIKKSAHFILQGKGGVGKTLVASLLTQYLMGQGDETICYDTDPVNHSLESIPALNVRAVPLFKKENETDYRQLDKMLSEIAAHPASYVIDNGASAFKPMSQHLISNGGLELLSEMGFDICLHLVIATGAELEMTLTGTADIIGTLTGLPVPIVIWVNEKDGSFIDITGTDFSESTFYHEFHEQISGIINIRSQSQVDKKLFTTILNKHLTFDEAENSDDFFLIEKARLKKLRKNLFDEIEVALSGVE